MGFQVVVRGKEREVEAAVKERRREKKTRG